MARLTIAQLTAQLETLRLHCNAVETERDSLRADLAAARAAIPTAKVLPTPRSRHILSDAEQLAHDNYVRALMAAKEMAMRTGRTVRVG